MNYSKNDINQLLEKIKQSHGVITPKNYFVQVPNSFVRNNSIDTNQKILYIYLWGFGGESMNMYPSISRINKELGWGKQKIFEVLKKLQGNGGVYIINRRHSKTKEKATNLYYLAEIDSNNGNFIKSSLDIVRTIYPEQSALID